MMLRRAAADQRGGVLEEMAGYGVWVAVLLVLMGVVWISMQGYSYASTRNAQAEAVTSLANRFVRDIRSARAHRVPDTDVLGQSNADGHEWDALYEDSAGNYVCRAQLWSKTAKTVQAYTFPCAGGSPTADGVAVGPITLFSARRVTADTLGDNTSDDYLPILSSAPANRPLDVELPTGVPGFNAGNAILSVQVANSTENLTVDLLPGSFETQNLTSITGTYTPPPATPVTCLTGYSGSAATGWTPIETTGVWQWYQTATPCPSETTPPPVSYTASYTPNCNTTFYAAVPGTAQWQQQPAPNATTPPPTTALSGYNASGQPIYQQYAWYQGPCPQPTLPPPLPTQSTPATPAPQQLTQFSDTFSGQGTCIPGIHPGEYLCTVAPVITPSGDPSFTTDTGWVTFDVDPFLFTVSGPGGVSPNVELNFDITGPSGTKYCLGYGNGTGTTDGTITTNGLTNVYLPEGPGTYLISFVPSATTANNGDNPQTPGGGAGVTVYAAPGGGPQLQPLTCSLY